MFADYPNNWTFESHARRIYRARTRCPTHWGKPASGMFTWRVSAAYGMPNTIRLIPVGRMHRFPGYADYMQTPECEKQIQELIQLTKEHRSALMCAEAVRWRCRRSLIGDAVTIRGIRTQDIMSLNLRRLHTLTSFAHVRGSTVTYPAENSSPPKKRISNRKKEWTRRPQ